MYDIVKRTLQNAYFYYSHTSLFFKKDFFKISTSITQQNRTTMGFFLSKFVCFKFFIRQKCRYLYMIHYSIFLFLYISFFFPKWILTINDYNESNLTRTWKIVFSLVYFSLFLKPNGLFDTKNTYYIHNIKNNM